MSAHGEMVKIFILKWVQMLETFKKQPLTIQRSIPIHLNLHYLPNLYNLYKISKKDFQPSNPPRHVPWPGHEGPAGVGQVLFGEVLDLHHRLPGDGHQHLVFSSCCWIELPTNHGDQYGMVMDGMGFHNNNWWWWYGIWNFTAITDDF